MTKLYACLGSGNCMKPWLALNQLGKDFELALVDVLKGEQKSPEYLAVNPLGVVPCLITDTDQSIGESNAMLWHIAHGTDLMPASKDAQAEALQWMFFEQSKLEPFISPARFFNFILPNERQNKATDIAAWPKCLRALPSGHLGSDEIYAGSASLEITFQFLTGAGGPIRDGQAASSPHLDI